MNSTLRIDRGARWSTMSRLGALTVAGALALSGCAADTSGGTDAAADTGKATGAASADEAFAPAEGYAEVADSVVSDAQAEKCDALVWYESSPDDQAGQVLAAFRDEYPFVADAQHVRLRASDVASRVVQESQADVGTASVVTSDAASLAELGSRDLLTTEDWEAAGVPAELVASHDLVATAASVFLLIYNSDLVAEKDAPTGWDDLLDPAWTGKLGTWESPYAFAELVPAWGGDKVSQYVKDFAAQQPTKYQSTFPLAQAVGAGEIEAGVGIYHSTLPAVDQGAPIELVVPDPVPVTMLYSAVPDAAACPATGALFTTWLATQAGASSYEDVTGRGNPLLPGTETARLVKDHSISDYAPEDAGELADWLTRLAR